MHYHKNFGDESMTKEDAYNQQIEPTTMTEEAFNAAINAEIDEYVAKLIPLDVVDSIVVAEGAKGDLYVYNMLSNEWNLEFLEHPAMDDMTDAEVNLISSLKPYAETFIFGVVPSDFPQLISDCESKGMNPVVMKVKEA